jgi:hypothetical protein
MVMKLKLKKGDKVTFIGLERDSSKKLSKILFESAGGNKIEFYADGEEYQYHFIGVRTIDQKKFEEELEVS